MSRKNQIALHDQAAMVSAQLHAMLQHTFGGSREGFHSMCEDHKDSYLVGPEKFISCVN